MIRLSVMVIISCLLTMHLTHAVETRSSVLVDPKNYGKERGAHLKKVRTAKIGKITVKLGDRADTTQSKLEPYFIEMIGYSNDKPCHDSLYVAGVKKVFLTWCSDGGVSVIKSIRSE